MVKVVLGKVGRRVKFLTQCAGIPALSGPGAWHVGECEVCHNVTQVAQWQEKEGVFVILCQICFD